MLLSFFTGGNVTAAFEAQRHAEPRGPLVRITLLPSVFNMKTLKLFVDLCVHLVAG